jgi:hypothetical protein
LSIWPACDLTGSFWTGLIERIDLERKEPEMARGKRFSPEQIIAMLRQIEVQLAQGKRLALACKCPSGNILSVWNRL